MAFDFTHIIMLTANINQDSNTQKQFDLPNYSLC